MATKKNWKTTTAGILAGAGILSTQLGHLLDEDPATVISWEAVLGALAVMGIGWFSRDKDVSSAASGVE